MAKDNAPNSPALLIVVFIIFAVMLIVEVIKKLLLALWQLVQAVFTVLVYITVISAGVVAVIMVVYGFIVVGTFVVDALRKRKGGMRMLKRDEPAFIDELFGDEKLNGKEDEAPEQVGGLPAAKPPQKNLARREQEKKRAGFWAGFFDPFARLEEEHRYARLATELSAGTKLLQIKAQTAVKKAEINRDVLIQDHEDKGRQWREVAALKNREAATYVKFKNFKDAIERLAELGLDPILQQEATKEIYRLYLARNNQKEECDDGCDECAD